MQPKAQFNLLPDLKLGTVRAQRTEQIIRSAAKIISAVAVGLFVIMLAVVYGLQKKQMSDVDKNIATYNQQISATENLNQILTVQNQLTTLSELHKKKHSVSRLFSYMPQVTPSNVSLVNLSVDLKASTMLIDGTADSQSSVNAFVDTLKFTTYSVGTEPASKAAFPSVVLGSFGVGESRASFSLNVTFDPALFNNVTDVAGQSAPKLNVPKLNSRDPANLFGGGGTR